MSMLLRINEALQQILNEQEEDQAKFAAVVDSIRQHLLSELDSQQEIYYGHYLQRKKTFDSEKDELMRFKLEERLQLY